MSRLPSGELESRVLEVLWASDAPLTPRDVHDQMAPDRDLAYTTVMTILVRLWRKGIVQRDRHGRAYAYRVVVTPEERAASRMNEVLGAASDPALALARFVSDLDPAQRDVVRAALGKRSSKR